MTTRRRYFTYSKYLKIQTQSKKRRKKENLICSSSKYHDPEYEKHAEPDLPNDGRVGLDLVQQRGQKTPLSHCL